MTVIKKSGSGKLLRGVITSLLTILALFPNALSAQESGQFAQPAQTAMEEILVTASKRTTNLQDTAMSITAVGEEDIERRGIVSAADYLNSVPSVRFDSYGLGDNQLVIRGLANTVQQQPTAGSYLGNIPLNDGLSFAITDVKLVDMARVEILRGPQGTLYGASAMGGAVRQIPNTAVLGELAGQLKVGVADVSESDDVSYDVSGAINIPLVEDSLALRVAGYYFDKPGYVDLVSSPANAGLAVLFGVPETIKKDTGGHKYSGVRGSLVYTPTQNLDVNVILGYQKLEEDGRSELALSANAYEFSVLDTADEFREQEFTYGNLLIDYDFGWGVFTSSTAFTNTESDQDFSHTRVIPSPTNVPSEDDKDGFFQEFRLATEFEGPVQFIAGVYYEDLQLERSTLILWEIADASLLPDFWGTDDRQILVLDLESELEQIAVFGELSYEFSEQWKGTVGARWFDYDREDRNTSLFGGLTGVFGPIPSDSGDLEIGESDTTFKVGLDFAPTDDVLLYASWTEGFRLGLVQDDSAIFAAFGGFCDVNMDGLIDGTSLPFQAVVPIDSDSVESIEVGGKFSALEGRLSINAAVYRTDWQDIPVTNIVPVNGLGCSSTSNGGEARSQGVEVEIALLLGDGFQVNIGVSYNDTEYLDDVGGRKGDSLPFAPENNASLGAQYSFEVAGRPVYARVDFAYVDDSLTALGLPDVVTTESYTKLGARIGIEFEKLSLELYGTNLTDEDVAVGVFNLDRGWRLEPRTIGLDLRFHF